MGHCCSRPAQRPLAHLSRESYLLKSRGGCGELSAARNSSNFRRKRAVVGLRNAASLANMETRIVRQPVAPSSSGRDDRIGSLYTNEEEEEDEEAEGEGDGEEDAEDEEQEYVQTEVSATNSRRKRKPPTYWHEIENVRKEVSMFWADLGVASNKVSGSSVGLAKAATSSMSIFPVSRKESNHTHGCSASRIDAKSVTQDAGGYVNVLLRTTAVLVFNMKHDAPEREL